MSLLKFNVIVCKVNELILHGKISAIIYAILIHLFIIDAIPFWSMASYQLYNCK